MSASWPSQAGSLEPIPEKAKAEVKAKVKAEGRW